MKLRDKGVGTRRLLSEMQRLQNTLRWSCQGWGAAWASEKSLRQWSGAQLVSVILTFLLPISADARGMIIALGFLLLAAELVNTALEEVVDLVCPDQDPRAKKAKDCASAAVMLTAIAAGTAWLVALIG
ncbi:diacylglycerol kinase [Phaeovulum sp.]|uniref:diacylglycerol kinase n=1 Tax=Phaeovulum sp. TaxID=2934796 RepID=UPI0039E4B05B